MSKQWVGRATRTRYLPKTKERKHFKKEVKICIKYRMRIMKTMWNCLSKVRGFGSVEVTGGKALWYFDGMVRTKTLMETQKKMGRRIRNCNLNHLFQRSLLWSGAGKSNQGTCGQERAGGLFDCLCFFYERLQHICVLNGMVQWVMWLIRFRVSILLIYLI